ncbi:MAG: SAM-dependent methyltransferase [Gammaproteobacteria bacterium]|nr:SAM-dependent methyltransferase [Gammaproteobacteria bacterium]MYD01976.1 SAM-dependent methyltransferase [Gammaproteobacteria bacterium]MYI25500.1 SAM-dependent methyltransferase [Gammaproteobacteria bacterium]
MSTNDRKPSMPPRHISAAIAEAGGWLAFDRYMELALYHPEEGYYGSGRARFGEGGDFDTAAETSALFGRALAGQCAEVLAACPDGELVELGPGSGRLAEVVLGELKEAGKLPQRYLLVEPAPGLRAVQRERLGSTHPDLVERLEWVDRLTHERIRGMIIANEVFDALPCTCFRRERGAWLERGVSLGGEQGLRWEDRRADAALERALDGLQAELPWTLPDGYCSEIRLNQDEFVGELAQTLEAGLVLLADYGLPRHELYLAERSEGTLGCHSGQHWHDDPFCRPGREDITAWVDFTAVARAAEAAGLTTAGYTNQAQFLLAAGILELAGSPPTAKDAAELRRLTLPGGMGEAFKFLGLATEGIGAPSGFGGRDLSASLDPARVPERAAEAARA